MTEKADHLIERAAALLRTASVARSPDPVEPVRPSEPAPRPRPAARNDSAPALPPGVQPILVAPGRPALVGGGPLSANMPRPRPVSGGAATDLRETTSIPLLSLEVMERAGLMVARNKRTRTSEEYRICIGRVLRALHEEPEGEQVRPDLAHNVVMITSARPGEGKSFTSLNLAGSIAQNTGESVLLVDVDPKMRPMTDLLGLSDHHGFMDLIADPGLPVDDLLVHTELQNLAVLPLGGRVNRRGVAAKDDSPAAVRPIAPTIRRLSERFPKSLILLDAPPCLATSDPHTLAPLVSQVVMVVEAERTQRNEVEAALELVRVCPMITMLLNKVRMTTSHTFGAYDYFGAYT